MSTNEVLARIQKVFGQVFGPKVSFSPSLSRDTESRWTSLKHVEFIIALEKEFAIRFDGADATDMISIPAVEERLSQKLS